MLRNHPLRHSQKARTSFLDKVVDGLLRLFILLQIVGIDSDLGKHFLEDGILAQILHVHHLPNDVENDTDVRGKKREGGNKWDNLRGIFL